MVSRSQVTVGPVLLNRGAQPSLHLQVSVV